MSHHSLPHYICEFHGVASDIMRCTPYPHFDEVDGDSYGDHDIYWKDWETRFAGLVRVSLLYCDYAEHQHSDRVMRQFGLRHAISQSPVPMTNYRRPKIPFNFAAHLFVETEIMWRHDMPTCSYTLHMQEPLNDTLLKEIRQMVLLDANINSLKYL